MGRYPHPAGQIVQQTFRVWVEYLLERLVERTAVVLGDFGNRALEASFDPFPIPPETAIKILPALPLVKPGIIPPA